MKNTILNFFVEIIGGQGVGTVTKPGLLVDVGRPAINPIPLQMMRNAVEEIFDHTDIPDNQGIEVTIIVPDDVALAKKTLH